MDLTNEKKYIKNLFKNKEKLVEARNILKDYKIQDIDTTKFTAAEVERYNILSKTLKKGSVKSLIGMGLGRYLFQTLVMGGITYQEAEQIIYSDDE